MQIIPLALRLVQLLFAIVVFGLSVDLARGQHIGTAPSTTGYSAFTGGFGIIAAIVGILALFIDKLDGMITWALDALAAVCFLAGGIAVTIGLIGVNCSDPQTSYKNDLISGGSAKVDGKRYWYWAGTDPSMVNKRCKQDRADSIFQFLSFLVCAAVLAYTFLRSSKRSGARSFV